MVNTQVLLPQRARHRFFAYSDSISGKNYRPDIDGLRAVAVLAVVGFHAGIPWLRGGFVGVDIFFVISGYLICSIIYKEISRDSFSIARFYARRFKRIVPALSVVLLFCLALAALVLSPYEASRLGDSAVATSLSGSNFLFIRRTDYFGGAALTNPLLMTWSLAVEEQFYIVFPLLMLLLRKWKKSNLLFILAALSVLSFVCSLYAEFRQPVWNFYLPITRAWELGAGTLLAVWQSGKLNPENKPSWKTSVVGAIGIVLIGVSIVLYGPGMRFPGYEAVPTVLGSVLILASPGGWSARVLTLRPLVALGLMSYSLYLWHWPLLSFAEVISSKPLRPITIAILMAIAFAAATASYLFIEKPFRARSDMRRSRLLQYYGVWIFFLVLVSGAFSVTHGLPWRYPQMYAMEEGAALYRHHPCISSGSYLLQSSECTPAPSSEPAMALLGDSHAEALSVTMQGFAASEGWHLVTLTRQSCPPTKGAAAWSATETTLDDSCRRFNRSSLDYVLSRPDIRVVLLAGKWAVDYVPDGYRGDPAKQTSQENAETLRVGLRDEIAALETAGKHVILMEDVPAFPYDPVAGVRNQRIELRRILNRLLLSQEPEQGDGSSELRSLTRGADTQLAIDQIVDLKQVDPRLTLIDPKRALCRGDRCYFANGIDLYYYDNMHLSVRGATQIIPLMPDLNGTQKRVR